MEVEQINQLVILRAVVGFLGEKLQYGWWTSAFFSPGSKAFIEPIFPRTQILAQYLGVTSAATIKHDEHIGIGNAFHLFRLPEDMEQSLHAAAQGPAAQSISKYTSSKEVAFKYLKDLAGKTIKQAEGPVKLGPLTELRSVATWKKIATYYAAGFENETQVFPFFSDN